MFKKMLYFAFLFILLQGCSALNDVTDNISLGSDTYHVLSFDSNGGSGEIMPVVTTNSTIKLPKNTFYHEGFIFMGWSTSSTGQAIYGDEEIITLTSSAILYAVWQEQSSAEVYYTITFDNNGGQGYMENQLIMQGKRSPINLNYFIKTGYSFSGWSLSRDNIPVYKNGDYITLDRNITLYACWSEDVPPVGTTYTIYYDSNQGGGYMSPTVASSGSYVILSSNTYTRDGFIFTGWSTTSEGTVEYKDNSTFFVTDNVTLYAVWSPIPKYKIRYYSNTSDNLMKEEYKYAPVGGNVVYLSKNEFTNGDMKFIGWSLSKGDNNVIYQDKAPLSSLTQDIDLYAVWYSNPVVIKFNNNNGKGTMADLYAKKGDKIILPPAEFTRTGYELSGSYTYYIDTLRFGTEFIIPDNATEIELFAGWRKLPEPEQPIYGGNSDTYKNVTVWVDGVTVKDEDWVDSVIEGLRYAIRKSYSGWYDTDQYFYNLCWAGASSNLLHWWYDRNKDNIEKYFAHYAPEGTFRPDMSYKGWGVSSIFQDFVDKWPNHGGYIETGLKWYLIGSNQNWGGAYFKDVFGDNSDFAEFHGALNQYKLNTALDKAFKNKMAIGASEINMSGGHAITIWGAHFDEEGLVDKIYVSDSATSSGSNVEGKPETGVMGIDIVYSFDDVFGKVYMKNYLGGLIPLTSVTLFSNCNDIWDEYFKNHSPIR